jgi:hypothetical protein
MMSNSEVLVNRTRTAPKGKASMNHESFKALIMDGIAAQGDLLIVRSDLFTSEEVDPAWEEVISTTGTYVVAHSETGHHHVLRATAGSARPALLRNIRSENSEITSLVRVPKDGTAEIVHLRDSHTHGTIILPPGAWYLLRQQRPTPEGWEVVVD